MKIGITSRIDRPDCLRYAEEIITHLEPKADVVIDSDLQDHLKGDLIYAPLGEMEVDFITTIGGDGTILRTLQMSEQPVFGINMGALGFLTAVLPSTAKEGLDRIIDGEYHIDTRLCLRTEINGKRLPDSVNEAVLHTSQIAKMRAFDVRIDGVSAMKMRADGLIIATPTGSTCYAMSVGAPIVDPKTNALIVVPIAPFKLSARPLLVSAESEIEVRMMEDKTALLVLDGQSSKEIHSTDILRFTRSDRKARFIRFDTNFYHLIGEKLASIEFGARLTDHE